VNTNLRIALVAVCGLFAVVFGYPSAEALIAAIVTFACSAVIDYGIENEAKWL
jgi:hypothetical protein